MKKEIEQETKATVKNNKFNLVLIILIVLTTLIVLFITLSFFGFKENKEIPPNDNTLQENSNLETNPPIISLFPNENTETDNMQNILDENTSSTSTENNTSENTNVTPNTNSSSNQLQNQKPNLDSNLDSNSNSSSNLDSDSSSSTNSNSNANSNTEDKNNSEGSEENAPPSSAQTEPTHKVKTETSTSLTNTEIKYGVVIKTYTTSTYDIYSDGTKKVLTSSDKIEYDRTNYNATTAELLSEAKIVKNQYSDMINQIFKSTNSYRQEANLNSINGISNRNNLSLNENLCIAACARAIEIAYSSKFSHTRPNGTKCYTILKEMNISYRTAGENISYGYSSADSVCEGWKNSQGHYENMISPDFSQIGIGVFKIQGTYYFVQIFN